MIPKDDEKPEPKEGHFELTYDRSIKEPSLLGSDKVLDKSRASEPRDHYRLLDANTRLETPFRDSDSLRTLGLAGAGLRCTCKTQDEQFIDLTAQMMTAIVFVLVTAVTEGADVPLMALAKAAIRGWGVQKTANDVGRTIEAKFPESSPRAKERYRSSASSPNGCRVNQ